MGTIYYGLCLDCKHQIDLDKFYSWSAPNSADYANLKAQNLNDFANTGFIYRSLRLHFFMSRHQGHRLGVYSEHEIDHKFKEDKFKEVYSWPRSGEEQVDKSDFTNLLPAKEK